MTIKLKGLTTDSPSAKDAAPTPRPVIPARRGLAVGENSMTDGQFLALHSTKEELQLFRAAVEARRARVVSIKLVLTICDNPGCRKWLMGDPKWIGSSCPSCGMIPGRAGEGGKLRLATPAEVKLHEDREASARAREERVRFEDDQAARRKSGLVPFKDIAEWRAARVADFQKRLRHEAEVAKVWEAQKKGAVK